MRPLTRYQVCRSCQALYKGIRKSAKEHAGKQALPQQAGSPERWVNLLLPPRAILRPSIFPENASLVRLARSGFAPLAALCPPPEIQDTNTYMSGAGATWVQWYRIWPVALLSSVY